MATLTILQNHPYFEAMIPSIWQKKDGRWTVRWRDFQTMKNDMDFDTQSEAIKFAARLTEGPKTVGDEWTDPVDLYEANAFWCGI
jgi:uncharacterized protein (DUF302 family)